MCLFSHDPAHLVNKIHVDGSSTPPTQHATVNLQDYSNFPSLKPGTPEQLSVYPAASGYPSVGITPPPGFKGVQGYSRDRSRSRPSSRHQQQKETAPAAPSPDDADAFPSLSSASIKQGKKHHGKRGAHGQPTKEPFASSTLADIVKMSPSPTPGTPRQERKVSRNGTVTTTVRNGENSAAAQAIPNPKHIPWLEPPEKANKAYIKARQEAIKHGGLRNKFLQRYVAQALVDGGHGC